MGRKPVHVFDAVMDGVKPPQERYGVRQAVGGIVADVRKDHDGDDLYPQRQRAHPCRRLVIDEAAIGVHDGARDDRKRAADDEAVEDR